MELLDRYLQAVKFWLPRAQQDDIAAELAEDIRSQIEDQEAKLGRKLNDYDVASILKERGDPLIVANRYLPQRYLIGPTLFPVYRFVLAIVALCYLVPWLLVWISLMIFDSSYRSAHTLWIDLARGWSSFFGVMSFTIGAVTAGFAVLERVQSKTKFLEKWDPLKLPPVRDPNRIPRFSSIVELAANLVFVVWWVTDMWSRIIFDRWGVQIVLSPAWRGFFWAFLVIAIGNIALAAVNLLRWHWTRPRAILRLALDSAGAVAFCWMFKANLLVTIASPDLSPAQSVEAPNVINTYLAKSFPFAVLACVLVVVLSNVSRLIRLRTGRTRLIQGLALMVVLAGLATDGYAKPAIDGPSIAAKGSALSFTE